MARAHLMLPKTSTLSPPLSPCRRAQRAFPLCHDPFRAFPLLCVNPCGLVYPKCDLLWPLFPYFFPALASSLILGLFWPECWGFPSLEALHFSISKFCIVLVDQHLVFAAIILLKLWLQEVEAISKPSSAQLSA